MEAATAARPKSLEIPEGWVPSEADLAKLTPGERLVFAATVMEMQQRGLALDGTRVARAIGPQTDEELLDAVYELTGHHIPRVTVCTEHGHEAPAKTFCDLYFDRAINVIWIGNRGGGKTANSGALHGAKCNWNPGYKSAIAGAVEKQGYRAYAEFRTFIRKLGDQVLSSILSKTAWVGGGETEVLGGTVKQLNGPHPHLAQMDEADLSTWEPFEEFLNMAQGDDDYIAQQLLTSTRKKAHGIVQQLVKETEQAIRNGEEPPWDVRIFCVFETMQPVPNCRSAPENAGRPEEELCNCNRQVKGVWDDGPRAGTPRRFDQVCGGRAYRSDGFVKLADVHKRFKQLSRMVWEAQQECLTPNIEGIVHKWFSQRGDTTLTTWLPHPEFGSIYRSWDWGGQNPNAVGFFQVLDVPVGLNADGLPILSEEEDPVLVIEEGTAVQFDEIYRTSDELPGEGGFSDLAKVVADRENEWRTYGFPLEVKKDYCDPSGFVAKREVKKAYRQLMALTDDRTGQPLYPGLAIPDFKSIPAPVYESVRLHISWGEGGRLKVVEAMCPKTSDEYDVYHWPDKRDGKNPSEEPVKEDDHAMDMTRYFIWNFERERDREQQQNEHPGADDSPREAPQAAGAGRGPFASPQTAPSESPVGAVGGGMVRQSGRMREQSVPSVRGIAGRYPAR